MATRSSIRRPLRVLIPAGLLVALAVAVPVARAQSSTGELIPSIDVSRNVHGDNSAQLSGGLAVRGSIVPPFKGEVRVAYRQQKFSGGDVQLRQWPVTASLWFAPIPALYAGGGVGWYHDTFHYADALGLSDRTQQRFGVHLGGGMQVPLVPHLSADLNGRYVFLKREHVPLLDEHANPDFWTLTAGLAIKL